ncbi:MAG: PQQ-binding-like beta-propeller repeat protein [Alphaproteobacteria bacterium]|nr:PQQ-binding-like beta-propeller repeat protein [Alphaproteobacteria bacterium]
MAAKPRTVPLARASARRALRLGLMLLALPLAGCDVYDKIVGRDNKVPLPGERLTVIEAEVSLRVDDSAASIPVALPRPVANEAWPQEGGNPAHAMHHLAANEALAVAWRASVGSGGGSRQRLLSTPVVAAGRVFSMDAEARIRAFDAATGESLWRADARPEEEDDGQLGGGIAFEAGRLFAATGLAEVVAFDANNGEVLWRRALPAPARGAPSVADGRVFVATLDAQVVAISAEDGRQLWVYRGFAETATLMGVPAPAYDNGTVVAGLSSGELVALRADSGRVVWSESLASSRTQEALTDLSTVRGRPAIDRGRVIAAGSSGMMIAVDLRTGRRIWEREIGSQESPWVAGDFVFVLTVDNELVALTRADGRIRWIATLEKWENPERRRDPIVWAGPVLVGDRLVVAGSNGEALAVSPYTGEIIGRQRLPGAVRLAPVVAQGTLYVLTDDADLVALR